jgi:hypothetical protein
MRIISCCPGMAAEFQNTRDSISDSKYGHLRCRTIDLYLQRRRNWEMISFYHLPDVKLMEEIPAQENVCNSADWIIKCTDAH